MRQAKTDLSSLLADVERGTEVIITRAGKPIARLVRFEPRARTRNLGIDRGIVSVSADFDAPLPGEVLEDFA